MKAKLTRLENTMAEVATGLGQLRESAGDKPDAATASQLEATNSKLDELFETLMALREKAPPAPQDPRIPADADPFGLYDFFFGSD